MALKYKAEIFQIIIIMSITIIGILINTVGTL